MGEPLDPVDRICSYTRDLYIKDIVVRKLADIVYRMQEIAPEESKWVRIIIEALINEIEFESATDIRCKNKVKLVLDEIQAQIKG